MINEIHKLIRRPSAGWDPVPLDYAKTYSARQFDTLELQLISALEERLGGLKGREVLDLGAGPGQYSIAFSVRGAQVVHFDISQNYQKICQEQAALRGATHLSYRLGYLDDADGILSSQFDLVFNRQCWYYCANDRAFSKTFFNLMKPGGLGYIETSNSNFGLNRKSHPPLLYHLYQLTGYKALHLHPPSGWVEAYLRKMPIDILDADYSNPEFDRLVFRRKMET